jgi:hypothetical protein
MATRDVWLYVKDVFLLAFDIFMVAMYLISVPNLTYLLTPVTFTLVWELLGWNGSLSATVVAVVGFLTVSAPLLRRIQGRPVWDVEAQRRMVGFWKVMVGTAACFMLAIVVGLVVWGR